MVASPSDASSGEMDSSARPLAEAAQIFGITKNALRQRFRRGAIAGFKDDKGHLYIHMDAAEPVTPDSAWAATNSELPEGRGESDSLETLAAATDRLSERLDAQDQALQRIEDRIRQNADSDAELQDTIRALAQHIESLTEHIRTLGASFRVHCQEVDRLSRIVNRMAGGNAGAGTAGPTAPAFSPPPPQRQRVFGRKQSDSETESADEE